MALHECLRGQKELQHKENEVFEIIQKIFEKEMVKVVFIKIFLISKNVEKNFGLR